MAATVKVNTEISAEIDRNKSIRIFGTYNGSPLDKTFKLGEMAEYGSYNLIYFGPIVGITDKTVTIQEKYGREPRKHRIKLYEFAWRNRDFVLAEVEARNAQTSMNI